ncbi:hypothetical protein MW887_011640 [Aspergillus wentii]|nr:hypothetical protein MW887_011640 [Aspergillus wentii]
MNDGRSVGQYNRVDTKAYPIAIPALAVPGTAVVFSILGRDVAASRFLMSLLSFSMILISCFCLLSNTAGAIIRNMALQVIDWQHAANPVMSAPLSTGPFF